MRVKRVYNPSTCRMETATLQDCPRCKGFGSVCGDEDGCTLCKKQEYVWRSTGGWTWPKGKSAAVGKLH